MTKRHPSTSSWDLAKRIHAGLCGASWQRSMREWRDTPTLPRAFYDGAMTEAQHVAVEDDLRLLLAATEREIRDEFDSQIAGIRLLRAAIDASERARIVAERDRRWAEEPSWADIWSTNSAEADARQQFPELFEMESK